MQIDGQHRSTPHASGGVLGTRSERGELHATMRSARVTCADGRSIHVRYRGRGSPLCLFVHGSCEGGYVWDEFISRIPTLPVAVIDLRGHGDSDWGERDNYRVESHADDIGRVINACAANHVYLIGHSLGAAVTIHVASVDRRVQKLVVVDFGPDMKQAGLERASAYSRSVLRCYRHVGEYIDRLSSERPLIPRAQIERLAQAALRERPDGLFELKCDPALMCADSDRNQWQGSLLRQIRSIARPTLIVRGEGSAVFPLASAQQMVRVMQNAQLRDVAMAGHAVMLDNPQGFADAVLPFLEEAEVQTASLTTG